MSRYSAKAEGLDAQAHTFKKVWEAIHAIRGARVGAIPHGNGSPEGVRYGIRGDMYINDEGGAGTTLWVKETGTNTNTGWAGK